MIGTQLTLVLLAAPAATAGAICLDRARGTLAHMLMTDLSVAEIVLGKLAARLVPVLTMLACTLPVLALVALLGGVDSASLLAGGTVMLGVSVLGCALALAFSLLVAKTHEALLCTYAILLLWLLAGPMAGMLGSTLGWRWLVIPRRSEPFFLALAPYWWPGTVGVGDYLYFLGEPARSQSCSSVSRYCGCEPVLRVDLCGMRNRLDLARGGSTSGGC